MKPNLDLPFITRETVVLQLAVCFLALPAFIYLLGFVQWSLAVPLTILLAVVWSTQLGRAQKSDWRLAVLALSGAALVLVAAGFPRGPFPWDWIKHWALINALANHDWPLVVNLDGSAAYLRFYIGAYLAPALASKWLSIPVAVGVPIWFGIGYALVLRLTMTVPDRSSTIRAFVSMLVFMCMAGADAWGGLILRALNGYPDVGVFGIHHEWWFDIQRSVPLQFGSMVASMVWVPHQSIATFLVAGLLALDRTPNGVRRAVLSMGLLALWSPYGMLGMVPLASLRIVEIWRDRRDWRTWATVLFASLFAVVVAASLLDAAPQRSICLDCSSPFFSRLQQILPFLLVELCVFILILGREVFSSNICIVSLATLVTLPFIAGPFLDFAMRAAMGPLFVLSLCSAHVVTSWLTSISTVGWSCTRCARMVFALALALGTVVGEITYYFDAGKAHSALSPSDPLGQRWYYTFAKSSAITVDDFFSICGSSWQQQYFIDHLPRTYRQPADKK